MKKILITSGPTREYLDPVRYLTNASSGRMGTALAEAVIRQGHLPVVVSGSVTITYPIETEVHKVETTEQMLERCTELFPHCIGVIGAAAPCDFKPIQFSEQKIAKSLEKFPTGELSFRFSETPDILAALGKIKRTDQWSVAFALETENGEVRAMEKLRRKQCDFVVLNSPDAIDSNAASFQVFDATGTHRMVFTGPKSLFAEELLRVVYR